MDKKHEPNHQDLSMLYIVSSANVIIGGYKSEGKERFISPMHIFVP